MDNDRETAHCDARRHFLRLAATSAGAVLLAGQLPIASAHTADTSTSIIDPQQALARLMEGNSRYAADVTKRRDLMVEREALVSGQHPFAAVLACADSRIAPEYIFDTGLGELFCVRVAGNFVTENGLASLEYAVVMLGTPLILVLGHDSCGAISAGVKAVKDNVTFPGKIQSLADAIKPSVNKILKAPGNLLDNAIAQNVRDTVARLKGESTVLADALAQGKLSIVGGTYRLRSGKVEFLA
ncbi:MULTISPECIES: carbonic anhydrase [unclassified Pseudomonas]|jgi:carbonic anhydrase|uniref:carbonic anhydrase n=1 Tax=unclassified Pseudomonas TaxID=196821 RepID=UPI0008E31A84|nr:MULTISPECIES: carbonic anhydrase [unclassified Pseudomonas]SFA92182.1 carbonic anhydrase [Pseudomonas sp. NFPP24]SFI23297.1 carbonic anhydrase [Pseudomonas sp. NFPP04]SFI85109.1 carbonic anhydrase [Pseudomonas sp. NFPP11]SFO98857.1 carbonic anhydrase [Pseudomonas sp. NFPP28]